MNSLANFQMGQLKSLKQIFSKFVGHFEVVQCLTVKIKIWKFEAPFDLEDQGQSHQFSKSCVTFR